MTNRLSGKDYPTDGREMSPGRFHQSAQKAEAANPVFVSYTNTREIIWDFSLSMMFH
jgi:hypothetical protein